MKKAFLIDLDGTIYKGKSRIPGASDFIRFLIAEGADYLFITNNAMRTPEMVAESLEKDHDIPARPDQVYTSVDSVCYAVKSGTDGQLSDKTVYVIGRPYLKNSLKALGLNLTAAYPDQEQADMVVVGLDQDLRYEELAKACLQISGGADFYLTNPDIKFPSARGFVPGCGTLGQLIASVTDVSPTNSGKPSPLFMEGALARLKRPKGEVLVLGDNLATDIQAAKNADIASILIETGVNQREDCADLGIHPDYIVRDYEELTALCLSKFAEA